MNKKKSVVRDNSAIFDIIKQSKKKHDLSLEQLLSIILNRKITKRQAKIYLDQTYGTNKLDWLNMTHLQIYDLALKVSEFKKDKQQKQRQQRIKKQKQRIKQQQQKKKEEKILNEMKRKNIKKDTMIQQVKESLKIYKQKIIQCKDQNEYQQLKLNVDNLQQSLSILQKNTFIKKYESKEIIDQEKLRQIEQQKQKKKLQLEKKRLQEQKKRLQEKKLQDERIQKERKKMQEINKNKKEIKRKLQIIFQQYGKHSIKKKDTFQNKSDKQIDLKGFLNYIRQFQILTDNFSVYDVVNYFKKQSQNGLCLKYEQFEQLIFKIASIRYKKINNMESTEDINLQFLNQHATNSQRMKKYFNVKQTKQKKHQFKFYVHSGKMKQDIIEQIRIRRENAKLKKKNLRNKSLTKTEIKNKQIVTPSHKKITLSHEFQKKHHSSSLLSYKKIFKSIEQLKDIQPEPDILKKIGYFDQQQLIQPDYDKKNYIIQLIKQKKKSIVLPPIKLK